MGYQAIITKYIGPRNVRGSRVKATTSAGTITIEWDDALNSDSNHKAAAEKLARKYGWTGRYIGGGLPDGRNVFVCDTQDRRDEFTLEG